MNPQAVQKSACKARVAITVPEQLLHNASEREEYQKLYQETSDGKFGWQNTSGLIIFRRDNLGEFVETRYQGVSPCMVSINQTVDPNSSEVYK